jgi:hypothetical protein
VNAQLVSIVDLRSISAVGSVANPATDHGNLSGLTDDDHPQYLSVDTVRGTLTAAVKASFLPSQTGNAGKFLTTDATSTSWASLTSGNITTALGFTPYNATNPAGYITGITSSDVTTALGFTPYNATNPSGFVTAAGARGAISVTGAGSYDSATGVINIVGGVTSFNTRTGAITLSSADVTTALGFTPYNSTNPSGYITGITSGMVTTALGFTPYNNSNPSGYITSSALSGYLTSASAASTYLPLAGGTLTGTVYGRGLVLNAFAAGTSGGGLELGWDGTQTVVQGYNRTSAAFTPLWLESSSLRIGINGSSRITVDGNGTTSLSGVTVFNNYISLNGDFYHNGNQYILNAAQNGWINTLSRNGGNPFINNVTYNGNTILHAGNFNSYALPLSGGTLSGALILHSVAGTNGFYTGTGDGASFSTYNFLLRGWNGMAFENPTSGGAYPNQVSGVVDFRNGFINMKGGFQANGSTVLHAGNYSSYALPLSGGTLSGNVTLNTADGEILVTPTGWRSSDRAAIKIRSKGNTPAEIDLRHTVGGVESGWHISARDTSSSSELHLYRFNMNSSGAADSSSFLQMFTFHPSGAFNASGSITQNGNQVLHAGNYSSYALPLSGGTLSGTLRFGDSTNGLYLSGGRLNVRSESTDNVAEYASYGLYLPKAGQAAGLYVESPIEARGGLRLGNSAGSGTITVGATTDATANRLVQRDGSGHINAAYIFGTYFNSNAGNSENPTIGQVWTQSTGDNYLRKSTPAHFISQLGLITTSNYSSYALPLSGGTLSGKLTISPSAGLDLYRLTFDADGTDSWQRAGSGNRHRFTTTGGADFIIGNGSGVATLNGNQLLHAGNYSSYALPLSGGTISGQTYISTSGYPLQLISTQRYGLQVRNTNNSVNSGYGWWLAHDSNSNFALHADGIGDILTVGRNGSFTVNGNTVLNAGNYNSYSPTLTGGNASGTWGINITGNSATANKTNANSGYARVGYGMAPFYNWGGSNAGAGAPSDSTYTTGIDVGSNPGDQAYGFQIASNMWNVGLWTRTYNSGFGGWVRLLDTSNYSSYALPLSGGTVSGNLGLACTPDVRLSVNGDSHISGVLHMGGTAGSYNSWGSRDYTTSGSRYINANYFEVNNYGYGSTWTFALDNSSARYKGNAILHAGNYTSYSPSLTGGGASGSWNIAASSANNVNSTGFGGGTYTWYQTSVGLQQYTGSWASFLISNHGDGATYYNQTIIMPFWGAPQYMRKEGGTNVGPYTFVTSENLSSFTYPVAAKANRANGWFYIDDNYGVGVVGAYSSYRYQTVYAMGDSYKMSADGTSLSNMYGIAWSHPNAGGAAGNLTDHGMLIINAGGFRCAISNSIVASGNITAYSDERLKTNWRDMPEDYVTRLAEVKVGIYDRIDEKEMAQVGVSAQSFQKLLPQAIMTAKDEMQTLSVNYGSAALASAVELAKRVVDQEKRIAHLESLISKLIGD